jgi:hypothetical protein
VSSTLVDCYSADFLVELGLGPGVSEWEKLQFAIPMAEDKHVVRRVLTYKLTVNRISSEES